MSTRTKIGIAATVLIVCIAVFSRFWGLDRSCLWFDEIFSVHAAEHGWQTILSFVALDLIHPPLFYVLLKLWISVGGESLVWLRILPVTLSCICIFPFLMIAKELRLSFWQRTVGLLIFAVNGSLVKYAQEVRMYSLLQLLSLISIWLFIRYFIRGKSLSALIVVNLILVYSHYFGWFVITGEVLAIVIFQRIKIRPILLMFAGVFVGFLPWVIAVLRSSNAGGGVGQNIGWMQKPGLFQLIQLITGVIEPFYFQASSAEPFTDVSVIIPIIILMLAIVVIVAVNWNSVERDPRNGIGLLALFVIVPCAIAFGVSWLSPYSIWGTRHLIVVFGPFAILAGIVIGRLRSNAVPAIFSSIFVLLATVAFVKSVRSEPNNYVWCAWEPLSVTVQQTGIDEPIFVFEDLVGYHLWFAVHANSTHSQITKLVGIDEMIEDTAYFLPRGFGEISTKNAGDVTDQAFWLMFRAKTLDDTQPPISNFVSRGYRVTDRKMIAAGTEAALLIRFAK